MPDTDITLAPAGQDVPAVRAQPKHPGLLVDRPHLAGILGVHLIHHLEHTIGLQYVEKSGCRGDGQLKRQVGEADPLDNLVQLEVPHEDVGRLGDESQVKREIATAEDPGRHIAFFYLVLD